MEDEVLRILSGKVGDHAHQRPRELRMHETEQRTGEQDWFVSSAGMRYTTEVDQNSGDLIIRGVQDRLRQAGYLCVIISADWDPDAEREAIHDLVSRSIDGIVFSETWHHTAVELLDIASKPYVFVHRQFAAPGQYSTIPDERHGAHLAMQHLISLGHRRIGYINGPEHYYASALRLEGYREELTSAGIAFDPALVERGDWELESGYAAMQRLLDARPRLTALFAGNDLMAAGAIYALQDAGLRVPEDVAVVGYDDRAISRTFRPRLTTVTLPCYEMGQAAGQMLLDRMEGKAGIAEEVQVRGALLVRESCGAAAPTCVWPPSRSADNGLEWGK